MKTKYFIYLLLILISCKKPAEDSSVNGVQVKVKKTEVIGESKVIATGLIINDNNASVQKVGFCWNTSLNPTIENDTLNTILNHGEFSLDINGLIPNTTYFIRAFAYTKTGIIYSEQITATTKFIKILGETSYRYGANYQERAIAVKKTSDGGFVVAGFINPDFGFMDIDVVVLKYNQACELQWSKVINDKFTSEYPASMIVDSDDNIVILSTVGASSAIIKISNQGNLLWRNAFIEDKHLLLKTLIETSDGFYAMVGYSLLNFGTHELEAHRIFVKTNKDGVIVLEKDYGSVFINGGANSLVEDKSGNFIFIGNCTDQSNTVDLVLNKVDKQGNAIWR